ncbi:MAG: hypothetical protein VB087_08340 [Candidatus Limiplasma sp.]|nr:hypothetical protein [Candidatus Limiplasma sp.]
MEKNACGIISYAGLVKEELIASAKAAFAQAQPAAPRRFDAFLPLFPVELVINMDYIGVSDARGAKVAPSGFSIDPAEYHRKLYTQLPALYTGDNYNRNFDYEGHFVGRGVFAVDAAWVDHFPQYGAFMGEKLMIHLIGGGVQAVAVPESIYPRGGGVLQLKEQTLQASQRVALYLHYVKARIAAGETYQADTFAAEYLRAAKIAPLTITQKEISRILQDMAIVKSLHQESGAVGLFTENARVAERVRQYMPMRYACDLFTPEAVDKHTARLVQLYFAENDHISDLWIPWQDCNAYVDKQTMSLDVRALCQGYQIAPRYDPQTFGGRYPDAVRVAVVRDRELALLTAEVINNPAYGDGLGPKGIIGRHVYLADSREMIRQRKLVLEDAAMSVHQTQLSAAEYARAAALAILQEHKGRLVDAMYRRETALSQMDADAPLYAKASQLMAERVAKLAAVVDRETRLHGRAPMSGYDADIDYLRRMQKEREGTGDAPQPATGKPIAFARDAQREQSIESGYAMRLNVVRMPYSEAAVPDAPPPPDEPEPLPEAAQPTQQPPFAAQPARDALPAAMPAAGVPEPDGQAAAPEAQNAGDDADAAKTLPDMTAEAPDAPGTEQDATFQADAAGQTEVPAHSDPAPTAAICEPSPDDALLAATADENVPVTKPIGPEPDGAPDAQPATDGAAISVALQEPDVADADAPPAENVPTRPHGRRVSLRELSGRMPDAEEQALSAVPGAVENLEAALAADDPAGTEPTTAEGDTAPQGEAPPEPPTSAEAPEPAKPKLAYILHRGSEGAAQKSYNRMSDLLNRRKK